MKKIVEEVRLMVKCCTLYYEDGINQQEISKILGISRPTVSRLLKDAKEQGIIKIEINNPINYSYHKLERRLEKMLGVKEVIIVEDKSDHVSQKVEIGNAAAKYLERIIKDGDIVGVSMGTTIKEIARFVKNTSTMKTTFIPLIGGVGQTGLEIHSNQIAIDLAKAFGGDFKLLHVPAVISNPGLKEGFEREESIKQILNFIKKVNIAIVGIGVPLNKDSTMITTGYFNEHDIESLAQKKAVGDICLQFYDIYGSTAQFEFNEKVFGIGLNMLKQIDRVIGVAGGDDKAESILGAVNGKYINILVTNYSCGEALVTKLVDQK